MAVPPPGTARRAAQTGGPRRHRRQRRSRLQEGTRTMWMTRVSIRNPVFATMVMVALCVLGLVAYSKLGVEQSPDITFPGAQIDIQYPGASPEAVEREVAKPLEEALNTIAGVERAQSRSFEGRVQASVEFSLNADMNRGMQEIRDRVAQAQAQFPREVKPPMVQRFQTENAQAIIVAALMSPNRSLREMSMLADLTVSKRLGRVEGVAKVDIGGMAVREVRIDLDPTRLRAYGITPAEISKALNAANTDAPVGLISNRFDDAMLRVEGKVKDPKDFANVVVGRRGDLPLTLGDLGTLSERERELDSIARINGQPAVTFNIFKQQDANIVQTGEAVKAAVEELRKTLPKDMELRMIYINSDFVKHSLDGLRHTLIEGALLTIAIVFLFLHSWRSTIITGLTLPISVISSFIAVYAFGFTLNFMTMMALSLCIGLLIDDAIVVRENIVRHVGMGKGHHQAAEDGTNEIGLAVMATTFAICAVFVPVAFMGGIVGKFFYPFGITVAVAVLVSLFVSFTLDPMLSSVWPDPPSTYVKRVPVIGHLIRATDRGMDVLHTIYEKTLRWVFSDRRYRMLVPPVPAFARPFGADGARDKSAPRRLRLATITPRGIVSWSGVGSFVLALLLVPAVGSEFQPQIDQGFTHLTLRMPVATSLERGEAKVRQVEEILAPFPRRSRPSPPSWAAAARAWPPAATRPTWTSRWSIASSASARRCRSRTPFAPRSRASPAWRSRGLQPAGVGDHPGLGSGGADAGRQGLRREGQEDQGRGRRRHHRQARPAGLCGEAQGLRGARAGAERGAGGLVAARLRQRRDRHLLDHARRQSGRGAAAPAQGAASEPGPDAHAAGGLRAGRLADLAGAGRHHRAVFNPEVIRRQNLQRREAVRPSCPRHQLHGRRRRQAAGGGLQRAADRDGPGADLHLHRAGQPVRQLRAADRDHGLAAARADRGDAGAAALEDDAERVLDDRPGDADGPGHQERDPAGGLRQPRAPRSGVSIPEALLQAGLIRMRPIIMTTAAMVFGMLPMAIALNEGGEIQAPMGRAIIGGVITSTILTLVVVPVIYSYLVRGRKTFGAEDPTPHSTPDRENGSPVTPALPGIAPMPGAAD
ncbi:acrB/AcrD/AcrF family domain-containing protein [Ditylenchus destructor]|nr:acrB/AcrD/AcrF family domain-containing protein [Ditylenchus destructor]